MPNWKKVVVSGSSAHLNQITGSTFRIDGNQSSNFIAYIDNDENSEGHVLKLATDGTGNGSYILDMENGSNTVFRARADGRFAFGNSAVGSMGAGTFVVGIDGGHTSDIAISKRLQHLGDGDTYVDFEPDEINFVVGGEKMILMVEGSGGDQADKVTINDDAADVDFQVKGDNEDNLFRTDAANDRVGIGTMTPGVAFHVVGHISGSQISSSGDIVADGDVVAYHSSDERLKDNLQVIEGSLDKIGKINGYEFDWNEKSPGWAQERGHDIGVVAQEVQKVVPEIVSERKNGYLGVDYKRIIPLLIESIKELKQEVENLKK